MLCGFIVKLHQAHNKNISARHIRAGSFVARQQQSGATVLILQRGMTGMIRPPSQTPFYLGPDWTEVRFCSSSRGFKIQAEAQTDGQKIEFYTVRGRGREEISRKERTCLVGVVGVSIQCTGWEIYEVLSHCKG